MAASLEGEGAAGIVLASYPEFAAWRQRRRVLDARAVSGRRSPALLASATLESIKDMAGQPPVPGTHGALPRPFYDRDAVSVAHDLLGKVLVHRSGGVTRAGRIVEVEAYLGPHDLAAHSARGRTARTEVMFGPPGHAYVYLIYGMHHCMNVVVEGEGRAAAVLLRAVEPVANLETRTQGPGLLCRAMHIDRRHNGMDLVSENLFVSAADGPPFTIVKRPRIGVDYAGRWARRLLRFYVKGSAYVSRR